MCSSYQRQRKNAATTPSAKTLAVIVKQKPIDIIENKKQNLITYRKIASTSQKNMKIRTLRLTDKEKIVNLLTQLGYPNTEELIERKINVLLSNPGEHTVVLENSDGNIIAFISIHIIPQIALEGDFARISYFAVDENFRGNGAGKILEEYCERKAKEKGCDRIEVHCHSRREKAHKFYYRQGYIESPKYLIKELD